MPRFMTLQSPIKAGRQTTYSTKSCNLRGRKEPAVKYLAGIAVNDGRLRDFFERNGSTYYPWLWDRLRPQLSDRPCSEGGVLLVDMKRRCLVGSRPEDASLFSGILDRFLDPERWGPCKHCAARRECPIWVNVQVLSDPGLRGPICRRLYRLILTVHLRRERRATVRDLRSSLAFLITHDCGCRTIHEERAKGQWPLADTSRYYFNAVFDGSGGPDLLLDEWQQLDPSLVPAPHLDRYLHFHRNQDQLNQIEELFRQASDRPSPTITTPDPRLRIAALKRRYVFEAATDRNTGPGVTRPRQIDSLPPFQRFHGDHHTEPAVGRNPRSPASWHRPSGWSATCD